MSGVHVFLSTTCTLNERIRQVAILCYSDLGYPPTCDNQQHYIILLYYSELKYRILDTPRTCRNTVRVHVPCVFDFFY